MIKTLTLIKVILGIAIAYFFHFEAHNFIGLFHLQVSTAIIQMLVSKPKGYQGHCTIFARQLNTYKT